MHSYVAGSIVASAFGIFRCCKAYDMNETTPDYDNTTLFTTELDTTQSSTENQVYIYM